MLTFYILKNDKTLAFAIRRKSDCCTYCTSKIDCPHKSNKNDSQSLIRNF